MPLDREDTARNHKIAKTLKGLVDSGLAARKRHDEVGDEVYKYAYDPTYHFLYQDWENRNGELFFKAKIPKAAQFVEVVGPYLYQYNPTYSVQPEKEATPAAVARFGAEECYLKWAAKRSDQYTHARRAVDDACIRGRGVLWTGYNPRRRCIQHVFDSEKNLIDDPDARSIDERNLVIRIRTKPKWELADLYPAARDAIYRLPRAGKMPNEAKRASGGTWTEPVKYYEAYMRVGLERYAEGVAEEVNGMADDSPKKYVFAGEDIFDILDWEIPYHLDDLWPCSTLDLRRIPNSIYPAAPMETGLGLLRALNWSHTLILSQLQITTRLPFVVMNMNGKKMDTSQLLKMVAGDHFDIAVLDQIGDEIPEIGKILQQVKIESALPQLKVLNEMLSDEFERSTGLYSILMAGQTPTQIRVAEDAKMKDRNSRSRVDDMRNQVEKWGTELGRKARFAARYLEDPEDIARILGPQYGQAWGQLAPPQAVQQRQQQRRQLGQQLGQQLFQQAMQQGQMQARQMGAPLDMNALTQQAQAHASQMVDQMAPDNLVDFEEWMLEADVSIEAGSMRRRDIDQEIDIYNEAGNTIIPALLGSPNPQIQSIALKIAARGLEVKGAPTDLVADVEQAASLTGAMPMALPAPAGAPAGPPAKAGPPKRLARPKPRPAPPAGAR